MKFVEAKCEVVSSPGIIRHVSGKPAEGGYEVRKDSQRSQEA